MCGELHDPTHFALISAARLAADEILEQYLRVPLHKAFNLGSRSGFDRAVASLAGLLSAKASESDLNAVRAAVAVLDVDWGKTTAAERRTLIGRALEAAGRRTAGVPQAVEGVFGDAATAVVDATRDAARRGQRLHIAADFNALDRRIIEHLHRSQANFVTDEYGRRNVAFGERAREIVAQGLEGGLGRADIAGNLEQAAKDIITGRGAFYWEVVAGSFVSRGRSFAQLSAYAEAGIERYVIEAVLDENTTQICRYLDGKSFTVSSGLDTFAKVEANPDEVKTLTPWVREGLSAETGKTVLFVQRGDERVRVAEVTRSAVGTRDDRGEFGRGLSERDLSNLGVSFPPYHGLCRSTTLVADI